MKNGNEKPKPSSILCSEKLSKTPMRARPAANMPKLGGGIVEVDLVTRGQTGS